MSSGAGTSFWAVVAARIRAEGTMMVLRRSIPRMARRGGHVQDGAGTLPVHLLEHELEQPVHGENVDPQHGKLLFRVGVEEAAAGAEARVVDEEVDALGGQYGAQGLAVDVAFQVGGEDAAGHMIAVLQLLGQGVQPVFPAGRQDEPETQPRVLAGELLPDAGRSTGDPDCFLVHRTCPFSEARSCVDGAQLVGGEGGVVQRLEVV